MNNVSSAPLRSHSVQKYDPLHWGWPVLGALLIIMAGCTEAILHQQEHQQQQQTVLHASGLTPEQQEDLAKKLEQQQTTFILRLSTVLVLEFGIALLVAYFVAMTVEKLARTRAAEENQAWREIAEKEHQERVDELMNRHHNSVAVIQNNVFDHLFRRVIPDSLLVELRAGVFNSQFVRENQSLEYEFTPLDGQAGTSDPGSRLLLMRATVTYDLANIASEKESLNLSHYFEDFISVVGRKGSFIVFKITECDTIIDLKADQLRSPPGSYIAPSGTRYCITSDGVRRGVEVANVTVSRRQRAHVSYTYETVRRYCDSETYFVTQPVKDGISIRAVLDSSVSQDIAFWPDTAHRLRE